MAAPIKLFINQSANDAGDALVESFASPSNAAPITLTEGDRAREVEIHPLKENPSGDRGQPFMYDDPVDWGGVTLAAGTIDAAVTSGTFTLTDTGAEQITGPIAYNASAAAVQAAIRAAWIGWSNATVTGNAGGPWILDRGSAGTYAWAITADTAGISPKGSAVEIANTQDGDTLLHETWELSLSAAPAILRSSGWTPLPAATASVEVLTVGSGTASAQQRVTWSADAYAGGVALSLALPHAVVIAESSVANPTVITTDGAHALQTGDSITISGHSGSTPNLNGIHTVTRISETTFSIAQNVTNAGNGGTAAATLTRTVGPAPYDVEPGIFEELFADHPASTATEDSFAVIRNGEGDYTVTFKGALANLVIPAMTVTQDLKVPVGLRGTIDCLTAGVRRLLNGSRVPVQTNLEVEKIVDGIPTTIAFRSDLRIRPELISSTPGTSDPAQGFLLCNIATGELLSPTAEKFRIANGIAPVIETVSITSDLTLTASHKRTVVTNYGATDRVFIYLATAVPSIVGTDILIANEAGHVFGVLFDASVPVLINGAPHIAGIECANLGDYCRLVRTNNYWLVLDNVGFSPSA